MGNLSAYEVGLDGFQLEDPTPLNEEQLKEIEKAKKNGKMELYFQQLDEIPVQVTISFTLISSLKLSHSGAIALTHPRLLAHTLSHARSLSLSFALALLLIKSLGPLLLSRSHSHIYSQLTNSLTHGHTYILTHSYTHYRSMRYPI